MKPYSNAGSVATTSCFHGPLLYSQQPPLSFFSSSSSSSSSLPPLEQGQLLTREIILQTSSDPQIDNKISAPPLQPNCEHIVQIWKTTWRYSRALFTQPDPSTTYATKCTRWIQVFEFTISSPSVTLLLLPDQKHTEQHWALKHWVTSNQTQVKSQKLNLKHGAQNIK